MTFRVRRLRRSDPVLYVIVALVGAATTVVYLHHRAVSTLDAETEVILGNLAERTARTVIAEIRSTLDGPVFDTLAAVNHPTLQQGRIDLVADECNAGLVKYPQIERFFMWNAATEAVAPGEVLFYGDEHWRAPAGSAVTLNLPAGESGLPASVSGFRREPEMGRIIARIAAANSASQQIYGAWEGRIGAGSYHIFTRIFFRDARRDSYFAVLGFVVNLDKLRTSMFDELYHSRLAALLDARDNSPRFGIQVFDEQGQIVAGSATAGTELTARQPFVVRFYPDGIRSRMASTVLARKWTIGVYPLERPGLPLLSATARQVYLLSGLTVLLLVAALMFVLTGHKRASELARMQTEFVSQVSHQLQTPLSLISAISETLMLDRLRSPERLNRYLDIVRSETAKLSALVSRILEVSQLEGRRSAYEMERVNLALLARETVEAFRRANGDSDTVIAFVEDDPGNPPHVRADPAALEQVLLNLLDNALKYSRGAQEISVRVGRAGGEAVLEVRDRGIGIDPGDLPKVFERFYRGAESRLNRRGFGLGLSIARDIVAAHKGTIEVKSAPGAGSTFTIRLTACARADTFEGRQRRLFAWARIGDSDERRRGAPNRAAPRAAR